MTQHFFHSIRLTAGRIGIAVAALGALYATSHHNYLLFHSLVELFSLIIIFGIGMLVWKTARHIDNAYLIFLGIALPCVGVLVLLHTLAYKGMGVFGDIPVQNAAQLWRDAIANQRWEANTATQLWIAQRYLVSLSFLAAPLFLRWRLRARPVIIAYGVITSLLVISIFGWPIFPDCLVEPTGLTRFKIVSEFVITAIFLAAVVHVLWRREHFEPEVLRSIIGAIALAMAADLSFTLYTDPHGLSNMIGHLVNTTSFYLIYKAILDTGLTRPQNLLYRNLKERERAFRVSEQRYRSLVEALPAMIAVAARGRVSYINPAGLAMLGDQAGPSVIGRELAGLVAAEDRELLTGLEERVERAGTLSLGQMRLVRLDGSMLDVEATALTILDRDEPAIQVVMTDITARKQAEAEREALTRTVDEQRRIFQMLVENAPLGILLLDGRDLRIKVANRAYHHFLPEPWRDQDLKGVPLEAIVPAGERERVTGLLRQVARDGSMFHDPEYPIRGLGPEVVYWHATALPLFNPDYPEPDLMLLLMDMTERTVARRQLEELARRLERMNRAKDEFLAMLGHELRNPLAPILNSIYALRLRDGQSESQRRFLEIIERQTQHMARLVDDLLDVSRITRGKIELRLETVDLRQAVRHAVESCQPIFKTREHLLRVELPETPLLLTADPARVEQILVNLLTNAAKYTEPGGEVALCAAAEDGHVTVSIRDNGLGLNKEMIEEIFEPFSQAERTLDRAEGGLGLGLTLVRSLARLHGGDVTAASAGLGQGSEFRVSLPLRREAVEAGAGVAAGD